MSYYVPLQKHHFSINVIVDQLWNQIQLLIWGLYNSLKLVILIKVNVLSLFNYKLLKYSMGAFGTRFTFMAR